MTILPYTVLQRNQNLCIIHLWNKTANRNNFKAHLTKSVLKPGLGSGIRYNYKKKFKKIHWLNCPIF